jgi:formylglycine-generating enzyme required for sulfatase activity
MGSNDYDWERPVHRINISKPFYMGKYQVTQAQWKRVMGEYNPRNFKGDPDRPVEGVSWDSWYISVQSLGCAFQLCALSSRALFKASSASS